MSSVKKDTVRMCSNFSCHQGLFVGADCAKKASPAAIGLGEEADADGATSSKQEQANAKRKATTLANKSEEKAKAAKLMKEHPVSV